MDNNIEEYLSSSQILQKELPNDEFVDYYYERRVSIYRSSTIMITESWGETLVICGEEHHYEEFI
jgi:hypothetical protein